MTVEANGPSLRDLVPFMKETLRQSRLILFIDHYFSQLPEVFQRIPHEGLYLVISNKYVANDKEFISFVNYLVKS